MKTDTEILDWLERNVHIEPGTTDHYSKDEYRIHIPTGRDAYKGGKTLSLREAISTKMEKQ